MNTEDTMFTLRDENGKEVGCEYFDSIEYKGQEYAVLLLRNEEEGELVFMHVLGDRKFEPLKDQITLNALYGIFQERHADLFEFE